MIYLGVEYVSILVIFQVVHLCVQSCTGDGGEHPVAAFWTLRGSPECQGDKYSSSSIQFWPSWPYLDFGSIFVLRWSETCRRTSARALASSPWPTTRRLLLPFRWFFLNFAFLRNNLVFTISSWYLMLPNFSRWTVTLLEIGFFRFPSKPTTGRFKVATSDSREPNAFQDLRSEKLLFSYFLIPTQILRKSKNKWISRESKSSWILPFHQICFWSCWCSTLKHHKIYV